jgi:hypothetical protein
MDRTRGAGGFIADLARQLESGHGELSAVVEAIAPVLDDEFRRHCRVGAIGNGVIAIHVDSPGLIAPMRMRWAGVVLKAVQTQREFSKTRRITFEFGSGGASFQP